MLLDSVSIHIGSLGRPLQKHSPLIQVYLPDAIGFNPYVLNGKV